MRRLIGRRREAALHYVPPAQRQTGLVFERLDDELLVYDESRHQAHALNGPAAQVLTRCDGVRDLATLGRDPRDLMASPQHAEVSPWAAWWGVWQLGRAHLLDGRVRPPPMPRRELLRFLVRSAVALPAVATLVAPTANMGASCATLHLSCVSMPCCLGLTCSGSPLYLCL